MLATEYYHVGHTSKGEKGRPKMAKPKILYVGQPIMFAHEAWTEFEKKFDISLYDAKSTDELIEAFGPGGRYSEIHGILRPNMAANVLPPLDKELISHLPSSCKIVSYCNHGYNGEDTAELQRKGIWYCNGAGCATESTADIGLFLILAVFRFTTFCELTARKNRAADQFHVEDICGEAYEPGGKVLGVIGMGDIGTAIAKRARALGMTIHYFNRSRKTAVEGLLGHSVYHDNVESILKTSDCIVLACPHTHETHHLLNARTLQLMKRGSRVVNVGRGQCIDEDALADALESGHISSAGLDVFHDEYAESSHQLWKARLTFAGLK